MRNIVIIHNKIIIAQVFLPEAILNLTIAHIIDSDKVAGVLFEMVLHIWVPVKFSFNE